MSVSIQDKVNDTFFKLCNDPHNVHIIMDALHLYNNVGDKFEASFSFLSNPYPLGNGLTIFLLECSTFTCCKEVIKLKHVDVKYK